MNLDTIRFYTKACSKLTDKEITDSANLFSNHYGAYSSSAPDGKAGRQIRLGEKFYQKLAGSGKFHVSFAYLDEDLLGQAYYLIKEYSGTKVSWVIQLVVHTGYRKLSIGKKLLYSVWGFSNDLAWGLATSNPLTIKTLESATFRKVLPKEIKKHEEIIRDVSSEIFFVQSESLKITDETSLAFTNFFVGHSDIPELINAYGSDWSLGDLPEGHEWVAFTFQDQEFVPLTKEQIDKFVEFSDKVLKEAYSRMNMPQHEWSKYAAKEISTILNELPKNEKEQLVADFGCGTGRHLNALAATGFTNLTGLDFSKKHIDYGNENYQPLHGKLTVGDCRSVILAQQFDLILCLYDVIGSFPDEIDNKKIIDNIFKHLKGGGIAIISVMNMELTEAIAIHKADIYQSPHALFNLKASSTMQQSGNIFKPEYYLIDTNSGLIYRKEIFENDDHISAEYIIRDKRYTGNEISTLLKQTGFEILSLKYVQAGHFDIPLAPTDPKAKEILLFVRKPVITAPTVLV